METKQSIRQRILPLRQNLADEWVHKTSRIICGRLLEMEAFARAKWIYLYIDCRHEVETGPILKCALAGGKRVAAPRVNGKAMHFCEIRGYQDLSVGTFHILEPVGGLPVAGHDRVLMVMPGVAFDASLARVGYGGGYYDRYLADHPEIFTAALAFDFQIVGAVEAEPTDIRPELLITESGIRRRVSRPLF